MIEDCNRILFRHPNRIDALYLKARAYQMLGEENLFMEVMKQCLKIQPKNQILLDKYYSFAFRSMPRNKRRMRSSFLEHDQFHFDDHNDAFSVDHLNQPMIEREIQGNISKFDPQAQGDFSAQIQSQINDHRNDPALTKMCLPSASSVYQSLSKPPDFKTTLNPFLDDDQIEYSSAGSFLSMDDLPNSDFSPK